MIMLVASYSEHQLTVFVPGQDLHRTFILDSLAAAAVPLRLLAQRWRASAITWLIDEDARFYHASKDHQRTKEEWISFWEVSAPFVSVIAAAQAMYGLAYRAEVIEPYISVTRKARLFCQAIIPRDFCCLGLARSEIVVMRRAHRYAIKIFDAQGRFYARTLLLPVHKRIDTGVALKELLVTEIDKLLMFVARERLVAVEGDLVPRSTVDVLQLDIPDQPSVILYTAPHTLTGSNQPRRLSRFQKVLLLFIAAMMVFTAIPFMVYGYRLIQIKKDTAVYTATYERLLPRYQQAQHMEQDRSALVGYTQRSRLSPLLQIMKAQQQEIVSLEYDRERTLVALTLRDSRQRVDRVLTEIKSASWVKNMTLVSLRSEGTATVYAIIVGLK